MCKWSGEYGSKKVLESDHTTELGKIPKKGKNSSVIFKEKRTNQILHTIIIRLGSKACFFGVSLEASLIVITFKIHKKHCFRRARFFSHSLKHIDVARRTNTTLDVLQECQTDD